MNSKSNHYFINVTLFTTAIVGILVYIGLKFNLEIINFHRSVLTVLIHISVTFLLTGFAIIFLQRSIKLLKLNKTLIEQNAKYLGIMNVIPDLFFHINLEGVFLDFRVHETNDLYVPSHLIIGQNIKDIMPPEVTELLNKHIQLLLLSGEIQVFEYSLTIDDKLCYYNARMVTYCKSEIVVLVRNITERILATEKIVESETKYRGLVNEVNDGIYVVDNHGNITLSNNALAKMLGISSSEELIGHNFMEFVHKDNLEEAIERFRLGNGDSVISFEIKAQKITEQTIYLEISSASIIEEDQITGFRGMIRDITDRKMAEEALAYERNIIKAFMDNATEHIYFKDIESRFTRISKAQANLLGVGDCEKAIGMTDFDFFNYEHASTAFSDEQEIMKTGNPLVNMEEKVTFLDGRVTWASTTKRPLTDVDGNIIGIFGFSWDITERKKSEEIIRESEIRYKRITESITDYLYTV